MRTNKLNMRHIRLTKGLVAMVDDEDFESLSKYKWHARSGGPPGAFYASRRTLITESGGELTHMHRVVMGLSAEDSRKVDHINGDRLDNRKANLRICSPSENMSNRKLPIHNTSGFRGSVWNGSNKSWMAVIGIKGKKTYVTGFKSKEEAARAYDGLAIKYHGEFARLNFPIKVDNLHQG